MPVHEKNPEPSNPPGVDGIEFIEFATSQPQALGAVLQTMGFMPVARHRSREVMLYLQGSMNLIINDRAPSHRFDRRERRVHAVRHRRQFGSFPRSES